MQSLSGFVPDKYGEDYVELDEPGELVVGGTERMQYTGGVWTNNDLSWRCHLPDGTLLSPPYLVVQRSAPVAHTAGENVYNENASALNEFVGFRVGQRETTFGALTFPFQAAGAIGGFVVKLLAWDWNFLDGNGVYAKLFLLYPLSGAVVIALLKIFTDAASIFSL